MFGFAMGSRYSGLAPLKWSDANGDELSYVPRRFLPPGYTFELLLLHTVVQGERLNDAMSPFDLVANPGQTIRITLPQGVPGNQNA
jgi:hypothetical protein